MISVRDCDVGLWKCGKGKAFIHIPTNFFILLKKSLNILFLKEIKSIALKMFDIIGFDSFSKKTFNASEIINNGGKLWNFMM